MLELAGVNPDDVVYDLGCGDGRILVETARRYGARAVGIEADPTRFLWTWLRVRMLRLRPRPRLIWGNFFHHSVEEATVVCLFLSRSVNLRLEPKLQRELPSGARVVSYWWTFEFWRPERVSWKEHVYVYRVPDRGRSGSPVSSPGTSLQ
jgi:precorrin-6B methylase 2